MERIGSWIPEVATDFRKVLTRFSKGCNNFNLSVADVSNLGFSTMALSKLIYSN